MNLKEKSKKLKIDIPAIFIALKKKETPLTAKIAASLTIIAIIIIITIKSITSVS